MKQLYFFSAASNKIIFDQLFIFLPFWILFPFSFILAGQVFENVQFLAWDWYCLFSLVSRIMTSLFQYYLMKVMIWVSINKHPTIKGYIYKARRSVLHAFPKYFFTISQILRNSFSIATFTNRSKSEHY